MAYNSAAYCAGVLGPGNIQNCIADIQGSGLTTVILFALHVGRSEIAGQKYGDLIFNDFPAGLLVSGGKFNPNNDPAIAAWPGQIAQLKQNSSLTKILLTVGGATPWVQDFQTIQYMFQHGMTDTLVANLKALRDGFTVNGACVIDGIDIDWEEPLVTDDTVVRFCEMVFDLKFEVTFCPYDSTDLWTDWMGTLWSSGRKVSWWNLQCYAGGGGNRNHLQPWVDALATIVGAKAAPSYLVLGLSVAGADDTPDGRCPTGQNSICTTFASWSKVGVAGGFVWKYDALVANPGLCSGQNKLSAYVAAINDGLDNKCG